MDAEFDALLRDLLGVPGEVVRTDVAHHPEIWADICGRYRLPPRVSDLRGRLALPTGVEVLARGGRLAVRAATPIPTLARGLPLHPDDEDDPFVFRLDIAELGMSSVRVAFGRDATGTPSLHTALGGQPTSLIGRPAPRLRAAMA
jgi:hypothetical protein